MMNGNILTIEGLLKLFAKTFYTFPVMVLLNAIFLGVAFTTKQNTRKTHLLIWYGLASILQDAFCITMVTLRTPETKSLVKTLVSASILIFILLELIFFFTFFTHVLPNDSVRKKIKVTGLLFIIVSLLSVLIFLFSSPSYFKIEVFIGYYSVAVSFILILLSLYYFLILFKKPLAKNLTVELDFWIITGILFLQCVNIPLFLSNYFLTGIIGENLYSINYIIYSALFVLFTKAMQCKTVQTEPAQ